MLVDLRDLGEIENILGGLVSLGIGLLVYIVQQTR